MTHFTSLRTLPVAISCLMLLLVSACNGPTAGGVHITGDTLVVTGEPTCGTCAIQLTPLVTIGSESDPVSPDGHIIRTDDGRFFVSRLIGEVGFGEYDASGKFVGVHGTRGAGPGEFRMPPFGIARAPGDTLVVYDHSLRRFSIFGPDGSFSSAFQHPFRVSDFTVTSDGKLLVADAKEAGAPVESAVSAYIISRDGSGFEPVGDSVYHTHPEMPQARSRTVSISRTGKIAVAKRLSYEILLIDSTGNRRVLVRKAQWFPPARSTSVRQPQITSIWLDEQDRLSVTIITRAAGATDEQIHSSDAAVSLATIRAIIEVFDTHTGALMATRSFEGPFVVNEGLAFAPIVQTSGNLIRQVWTPTLLSTKK